MQIVTRTHGFALTDALRHHVRQRLHFAFDRISERIRRVVVRLSDINGPRGGADKRCQLQVHLDQLSEVVIEDTQSDLYAAVDRAAERAARTVARRLSRVTGTSARSLAPSRNHIDRSNAERTF